jgi:hypothetical protein
MFDSDHLVMFDIALFDLVLIACPNARSSAGSGPAVVLEEGTTCSSSSFSH